MNTKKNKRYFNCAKKESHNCYGFVSYDHLELAKAKKLYDQNPVEGCTGEWYRLYKSC